MFFRIELFLNNSNLRGLRKPRLCRWGFRYPTGLFYTLHRQKLRFCHFESLWSLWSACPFDRRELELELELELEKSFARPISSSQISPNVEMTKKLSLWRCSVYLLTVNKCLKGNNSDDGARWGSQPNTRHSRRMSLFAITNYQLPIHHSFLQPL